MSAIIVKETKKGYLANGVLPDGKPWRYMGTRRDFTERQFTERANGEYQKKAAKHDP